MPRNASSAARALDQYYTRRETAALCLDHLGEVVPLGEVTLFLEPSAGDGAFLDQLPEPRLGLDIQPTAPGIETCDYLTWQPIVPTGPIAVVGNPPFGRNAALAVAFFNHSASFAEIIAMIFPASFAKSSMMSRLDPRFVLVSELPLPGETYLVDGQPHDVNTVFQVWRRGDRPRVRVRPATSHPDFMFVASKEEADFAVRRVGARAGAILHIPTTPGPVQGLSPSSNLFVRAVGCSPAVLETRFRALDTEEIRARTVALPSLSKSELVTLYEAQLLLDRASASSGSRQVRVMPVVPRLDVVPSLSAPELAFEGDVVAMIVRHHADADDPGRMRREVDALRRRKGLAFPSVLLGGLRDEQKRRARTLLEGLAARQGPWSGTDCARARVTILFNDTRLHLESLGGDRHLLTAEICRRRGDTELDQEERMKLRLALGQTWLRELGHLGPPHRAAAATREIEPDLSG